MSALHYYNEIEPYAVAWLRNLMADGLIPAGDIDTRSIEDVRPSDLAGYVQCHFFAGIAGWPLALALAGWPVDRPVWTGSCPCQPFSVAGKGDGAADKRHLWPAWFHLISQCRPPVVFGEQVAAAVGHQWLDGVCADLEGKDYAIGASVLPACAVRAPHRRDRLIFVADTGGTGLAQRERERGVLREVGGESKGENVADANRALGNTEGFRCQCWSGSDAPRHRQASICGCDPGALGAVGDSNQPSASDEWQQRSWQQCGLSRDPWSRHSWIIGHDGKARRVEPGIRLLAHGVSGRMVIQRPAEQGGTTISHTYSRIGALRGFGNAIVPQKVASFIAAYAEARGLTLHSVSEAA